MMIINNFIDKNNNKIIINLKAKLFIPIYNVLNKIETKRKFNLKKEYSIFLQKLKQNSTSINLIYNLYNKKNKDDEIINNYKDDNFIENYYKNINCNYSTLIQEESSNYSNIIIPTYIMKKYNNDNKNIFIEKSNEQKEKNILNEFEKPILSIKSKYYNNENKDNNLIYYEKKILLNKDETKIENNLLIGNKRYRNNKLKDNYIDIKKGDKKILLDEILDIISNLPGITIKTLRKILNVNSNNFYIEKNIITYMINIGLLYAQDYDEKNLETTDDTKLFSYSDINLYI